MLIEAHHSVGLVERYYVLVRRAFEIVTKELLKALREDRLQMAIKAINDTAGPNGLAMKEVRKCHAAKQVKDALKRRNGPITEHTLDLLISSRVLVWRENQGSTLVKPYYSEVEKLPEELQVPEVKVEEEVEEKIPYQKYDLNIPTVPDEKKSDSYVLFTKDSEVLITDKKRRDHKLLAKLRAERIIKSLGAPFQESRAKELARLIA
ncbi:polyprotein [Drepanopeziza brunnea f. sp. 'multigermtubi' MB_m1]|uniref:Polyprotein n=1 Tax=Marssonina brunnea f. sp. multigermtubi (strain MB_m1) TaxID=1072389 RepID=K1WVG1_MARBU|nr:polyprotein [Drepanopeziza brunnea f. sp. 'multigermtubi' MB_m1]EKD16462.1 polyprotein [Drepanopeziza brunnea f. sp. 'multigermtubi' MB_m1]